MDEKSGKVYLVGAGPGAPDLLTLRAAEILKRAEVVFHDALVHPRTLELAARARKFAVGKRSGRHSTAQKFINKRLVDAARDHKVVVRLKGGDPTLFGCVQEEIDALRAAGIDFEIVPGVTAATAASAELGVSLTRRGFARHVVFVTPRTAKGERENDWVASGLAADTAATHICPGPPHPLTAAMLKRREAEENTPRPVGDGAAPQPRRPFWTPGGP